MINFFKKSYKGLLDDPRPIEERLLDYKHEDLIRGTTTISWVEGKQTRSFPIQNQDGSSSCVAQSLAKLLSIHEVLEGRPYTRLSPKFIYTRRTNYPAGGMWMPEALKIACNEGSCEEALMPSDNKGESFMNDKYEPEGVIENAKKYKGKLYFEITNRNIDNIAEVLEQGYGVSLGFRFDYNEWTDFPLIYENSKKECGHAVAVVDYTLINGKKYLVIEDSWGPGHGKGGVRYISEEFLNARCFYAGYITSFTGVESKFVFTKTLRVGSRGLDVKMLQTKLGIKADGKFGEQTKKAVIKFQKANKLKADGIVGIFTNYVLNKI
jgi:hypothetical protein